MTYSIQFHPQVKYEIRDSYSWYESQNKGLGERIRKLIFVNTRGSKYLAKEKKCVFKICRTKIPIFNITPLKMKKFIFMLLLTLQENHLIGKIGY